MHHNYSIKYVGGSREQVRMLSIALVTMSVVAAAAFMLWFVNMTEPVQIPVSTTPLDLDKAVQSGGLVINEY